VTTDPEPTNDGLELEAVRETFEASADFTVGIEEEFAVLDALSLDLVPRFEELREVIDEEDIVVAVLAVPSAAAQRLAEELVDAGVKIIFNYSDALLQVPPEVTVHTSSPAVDLLYALYFYLT